MKMLTLYYAYASYWGRRCACHGARMEVRGRPAGVSLPPTAWTWAWSSGHHVWQQAPLSHLAGLDNDLKN